MKKILKSLLFVSLVSCVVITAVAEKRKSGHGYQDIEDRRAQILAANNIVPVATRADLYEFTSKGFGFLKCADYPINQAGGPDNPIIDIRCLVQSETLYNKQIRISNYPLLRRLLMGQRLRVVVRSRLWMGSPYPRG